MVKRIFILLIVCFLLAPLPVAHADVINTGPIETTRVYNKPLVLFVSLIVCLFFGAVLTWFWKRKKGKKDE